MKLSKVQKGLAATIALAVLIGLTLVVTVWGCGKKGPPEPPTGSRPPAVTDLSYSISKNITKLTWTVPRPDETARLPLTGFLIFRSQRPLLEADCPNCPTLFKLIGDVPARGPGPGKPGAPPISFTQTIEPGFRYLYKVNGYSADGLRSGNSNFVGFTF
jgi:predicted small lipoprotein YifL